MKPSNTLLAGVAAVAAVLVGSASVAWAQNQPPPAYPPPPGYQQQQPPPIYQQPPPAYQQPPPAYQQPPAYYPPPPPPPPPRGVYRDGFLIGFGLGFGALSASNCGDFCGGALGLSFNVGGMVNPRLGIMFDGWVNLHPIPNSDGTTSNSISTVAAQYWLTEILWMKGGIGFGTTQVTSESAGVVGDSTGLGLLAAIGIELFQGNQFAFDVQARLGTALHGESDGGNMSNFALLAGLNWY